MTQYFEFKDEKSAKFWEITQNGNAINVRFGKIGTNGQTSEKSFDSQELAQKEYNKLTKEKTGKGYLEVGNQENKTIETKIEKPVKTSEITDSNLDNWLEKLLQETTNQSSTVFLFLDSPTFLTLETKDEKFIYDLTFNVIEKLKTIISYNYLHKVEDKTDENKLSGFLEYLLRWRFAFKTEDDFITLLTAFEFEINFGIRGLVNGFMHLPVSLTLGKLNVFATQNKATEKTRNIRIFIKDYPKNKNFMVSNPNFKLDCAEVFLHVRPDLAIVESVNSVAPSELFRFAPEAVSFQNKFIEQGILQNPKNYKYLDINTLEIIKTINPDDQEFSFKLIDSLIENIKFMNQNTNAYYRPFDQNYENVKEELLGRLLCKFLESSDLIVTKEQIMSILTRFDFVFEGYSGATNGLNELEDQTEILLNKLAIIVQKRGMTNDVKQFLTTIIGKKVKLKGVLKLDVKANKKQSSDIGFFQKQVAETGKITIELQENLSEWFNIADNVPLINGKLYNIGFFLNDTNPENETNINWQNLATDLDFLHHSKSILKDANCMKTSMTDAEYYPFILHKPFEHQSNDDYFNAFGIIKSNQINSFFYNDEEYNEPKLVYPDFFDDENELIEQELEMDEDADISEAKARMEAYEKVNDLIRENLNGVIHEFGILSGYDRFPMFKFWKSKTTGNYIGFLTLVSDRYIYE